MSKRDSINVNKNNLLFTLGGIVLVAVLIWAGLYFTGNRVDPIATLPASTSYNLVDPNNQEAYKSLEQAYNDATAAGEDATKLMQAYFAQASAYNKLGDTAREILVYKLINKLYPDQANSFDKLGDIYSRIGLKDDAIKQYQQALAIDPQNLATLNKLNKLNK